tara:strand:+ start:688 stop:1359 length:672 start_codon:yes stop_codon:yes gene_type:complete
MFINLRELKNNPGAKIKLVMKKNNGSVNKQWTDKYSGETKSMNLFQYIVEKDNQNFELEASDALARKLNDVAFEDAFMLSFEPFEKDGQTRHYWKVEVVEKTENEFTNFVAKQITNKQIDQNVNNKVIEKSAIINSGARFGMVFNNTFKLYTDPNAGNYSWTTEEFANEFLRVLRMVEACENIEVSPAKKPVEKTVKKTYTSEPKFTSIKEENTPLPEDDLPF